MKSPNSLIVWFAMLLLVIINFDILHAEWIHGQLGTIVYSVFVPSGYSPSTPIPLIAHFHGAGERGSNHENLNKQDLNNLASDSSQKNHPCIIYAPQCPANDQWVGVSSWSQVNFSMQNMPPTDAWINAMKGLDTILAKYSIDNNRIYIVGGSLGGYCTWYTLCKYPSRFAAAVPIAGGGDTNAIAPAVHVPTWAFHGTNDGIVPVSGSRSMVRALVRAGGTPKLTEYSINQMSQNGYDHYGDHIYCLPFPLEPTLKDWIFSKTKATTSITKNSQMRLNQDSKRMTAKVISIRSNGSIRMQIRMNGMYSLQGKQIRTHARE
jgi:predicted peptidase